MADLDVQPQAGVAAGATSDAPAPPDDPLAHLKKMSTTAGLTSGTEYAAINPLAVASVILGVASVLALLSDLWLVVPAAAVVCATFAIVQIKGSNGTQTGRWLAVGGILIALALGGGVAAKDLLRMERLHSDRKAVATAVHDLGAALRSADYRSAYGMFDAHFHERVPFERFSEIWKAELASGPLRSMEWNQTLVPLEDAPPDTQGLITMALMHFDDGDRRQPLVLLNLDGKWIIHDMPYMFPPEQKRKRR